jgi:hypothetical protein
MDTTTLLVSFLFGLVGMGYLMYGKNAGHLVCMGAGVALMMCPYFIANVIALLIVSCALMVVPFIVRDA